MTIARIFPAHERPVLIRGFLVATGLYVAGHLVLWASMYRPRTEDAEHWGIAYATIAAMWLTFIVLAARVALAADGQPVAKAALVSAAAVLAAGLFRVGLAGLGMTVFLSWDHDDVVVESAAEQLIFALYAFCAAALVAIVALTMRGVWRTLDRRGPSPGGEG